jgi:WXG100 family type VII secretion target
MSQNEIKLDYDKADNMAKTFAQSSEQLQDTLQEVQKIANTLEAGALLGQGGQTYVEAIRGKLSPSLSRLIDKFQELESDVRKAIELMKQADEDSAKQTSSVQ